MKSLLVVIFIFLLMVSNLKCNTQHEEIKNLVEMVKKWGENLGNRLHNLANEATQKSRLENSFKKTIIVEENGLVITKEIAKKIRFMMRHKEKLLKKIVDKAEFLCLHQKSSISMGSTYDYYNSENITDTDVNETLDDVLFQDMVKRDEQFKCEESIFKQQPIDTDWENVKLNSRSKREEAAQKNCSIIPYIEHENEYYRRLPLIYHPQFEESVNLNYSVLKIGTNIYYRTERILNDVRWSEALDFVFKSNFKEDTTLKWQFFAGTSGFLRHYPAIQWSEEPYNKTFEFRTRAWYLESISSPKDVVILLDKSGSMWRHKWKTAKFLVNNILDTLGDNDYVNVYVFENITSPLVHCFNFTLMQAHEENLRLLRESLDEHYPNKTADLTKAFHMAFATLAQFRKDSRKMHCNQMIMFVSDSVDYDYNPAELFNTYNRGNSLYTPVRVFTFLIGTSESDAIQMQWIACANMGYFVNISLTSDIAEQVLKYLNVLSRPLNLNSEIKPNPVWTGTYVDLSDRRLTNWLWNKHEGNVQRDIFLDYTRQAYLDYGCLWDDVTEHILLNPDHEYSKYLIERSFNYMTTVSLPAYDRRPNKYDILGVAGIDVPIEYIKTLTQPYRIGVNGYAFILTNNGLLVIHPDHRKEFKNNIKPTFNRVDMTEVEIIDDLNEPRDFNKSLLTVREHIVNQEDGDALFDVKTHVDKMRRLILSKRHYYYTKIEPFSLVVALPEHYGRLRIKYEPEKIDKISHNKSILNGLRKTKKWLIHPEWLYCKYYGARRVEFVSPEAELLHYLNILERNGWQWLEHCSPELVNHLILDADATKWYEDGNIRVYVHKTWEEILSENQIRLVFFATHTGLTRWKTGVGNGTEEYFIKSNNKAIDEVWYKRSVEYNYAHPEDFLYSVPLKTTKNPLVGKIPIKYITVSQTIFKHDKSKKSPIGVTGFQLDYSVMETMFTKITTTCDEKRPCPHTCDAIELHCFILDDNAYVVVSEESEQVGEFIGNIRPDIMSQLVEDGVYKQTRFFDYQGICYLDPPKPKMPSKKSSAGHHSFFRNILRIAKWALAWMMCLFESVWAGKPKDNPCFRAITGEYNKRAIKKTLPTPCDKEMWMYTTQHKHYANTNENIFTTPDCLWNYIIQPVTNSNLLLLIINAPCSSYTVEEYPYSPIPVELEYNLSMPCYIATKNDYVRRQYIKCINKHKLENNLNLDRKYCGVTWK